MAWSWMSVGRSKGATSAAAELLSIAQLQRVLARERARADRNGHHFSIVIFDIQPANGDSAGQHWRLADMLFSRLRCTDEVGWFDEGRLAAVLPDTPLDGAWKVAGDIRHLADGRIPHLACAAYTYPPASRVQGAESRVPGPGSRVPGAAPAAAAECVLRRAQHALSLSKGVRTSPREWGWGPTSSEEGSGRPGAAPENHQLSPQVPAPSTQHAADELQQRLGSPLPRWKRVIDIVGAAIGLVLFAPLMVLTAVLVKATSPGPAIFTQARIGKDGAAFPLYKFRTMSVDADERKATLLALNEQTLPVFKMKSDPRVTPLGRLLRKSSLDELPQLWNVLKGDMSLVGPRPPTVDEVQAYERWHHRRLALTPGLTCIWQVSGRSLIDFPNWVRMDIEYAERRSFLLDVQILARTIPAVLSGRGAH